MRATKRDLVGRRIVAVHWNKFKSELPGAKQSHADYWATDPRLVLDNGRELFFVTQETEVGEYGIAVCITEKPEKTK